MTKSLNAHQKISHEAIVTDRFLEDPNEDTFTALFNNYFPQLISFFRTRSRESSSAEDLAQEVMIMVYRKSGQIRDRSLFRAWLFRIASNTFCRDYGKRKRELEAVNVKHCGGGGIVGYGSSGSSGFEFRNWMSLLNPGERDVMTLRFIEEWEYHEIAKARAIPIGTVQWRVFNSKKKLAARLMAPQQSWSKRCSPRQSGQVAQLG